MSIDAKSDFSLGKLLRQTLIVFAVFMIIDFLTHLLRAPGIPYGQDIASKIIWTLVLAAAFSHLFNLSTLTWIPVTEKGRPKLISKTVLAGTIFGFIIGIAFLAAMAVSYFMFDIMYVFILEGIRGVPPDGDTHDVVIVVSSTVSGAALAYTGKEEAPPDR